MSKLTSVIASQLQRLSIAPVIAKSNVSLKRGEEVQRMLVNYAVRQWNSTASTNAAPRKSNSVIKAVGSGSLLFLGFGIGLGWCNYSKERKLKTDLFPIPSVKAALPNDDDKDVPTKNGSVRNTFNFIAEVIRTCVPSVVYIEIIDTHFNRVISNGSGVIVSEDGLILTNAHVVTNRGRNRVQVKLHDGRTFIGAVEDTDMPSDLALVRIPCRKLPVMKLGVSSDLQAGEWVVAIGSPLSLSNTVTAGIVSSTNRKGTELGLQQRDIDYIQTDASITFGNSGGPLVNLDGEAIGINSMKITAGISFAIPIDYAKQFLEKYKEKMKSKGWFGEKPVTHRRYMGITMVTLTPQLMLEMQQRNIFSGPDIAQGVLVVKVVIGSPAHSGGMKPGDIVTHINGQPVDNARDIYSALESTRTLEVTVVRGKETLNFVVVPED